MIIKLGIKKKKNKKIDVNASTTQIWWENQNNSRNDDHTQNKRYVFI